MTQYMEKMAIGDSIDVKGPLGHFVYKGKGIYSHHGHEGKVKQMSMIAGGTGITPMWQVVQVIVLCRSCLIVSVCVHCLSVTVLLALSYCCCLVVAVRVFSAFHRHQHFLLHP